MRLQGVKSPEEFDAIFLTAATLSMDLDSESKLHEVRSSFIARYLAELSGVDPDSLLFRSFLIGAIVHDDGKGDTRIKERIRIKGKLSDQDRSVTQLHPVLGTLRALMNGLDSAAEYPMTHHVFYDRSVGHMRGYPAHITDAEITGLHYVDSKGQNSTVADALNLTEKERTQYIFLKELLKLTDEIDAFCSRRVYRDNRLTSQQLQAHLKENTGIRFNPDAVALVLQNIDEIRFFHYLMYRLHNKMTLEMNLSSHTAEIETSERARTADGQDIKTPTLVHWNEMGKQDVINVVTQTTKLYNTFVTDVRIKYRAKLRTTSGS